MNMHVLSDTGLLHDALCDWQLILLVQVRLGPEVLLTPSSICLGFEPMT